MSQVAQIQVAADAPTWAQRMARNIEAFVRTSLSGPQRLSSYTVQTLPDPTKWRNAEIYVSNESGGAVPAFSDGTNWRRVTDRNIVS